MVLEEVPALFLHSWLWVNGAPCSMARQGQTTHLHFEGLREARSWHRSIWAFFRDVIDSLELAGHDLSLWDCVRVKKGTPESKLKKVFGKFGSIFAVETHPGCELLRFNKLGSILRLKEWRNDPTNRKAHDPDCRLILQSTLCM